MPTFDHAPETKAGIAGDDAQQVFDALMRAFEDYKTENDTRLKAIEAGKGDVLLEEKVDRINDAPMPSSAGSMPSCCARRARRSSCAAARVATAPGSSTRARSRPMCAGGDAGNLRNLETKALSVGSNPDGGYLVPPELEHTIGERLAAISPIRSIAAVREISSSVYKKPFMTAGPATGWVGETDGRPQTASPTLDALSFPAMELYAMPAATATLLDDAAVNIDDWIASEVELVFAAGGRRLRQWRRRQQAEGLCSAIRRWRTARGAGAISATSRPAMPARLPPAMPPTCWSI
ncbi:MAG: phage major capsid protein [Rhodopseudomonas palustris]|nr:phage major capsid protein [Rhodopseudomonas palustris]